MEPETTWMVLRCIGLTGFGVATGACILGDALPFVIVWLRMTEPGALGRTIEDGNTMPVSNSILEILAGALGISIVDGICG